MKPNSARFIQIRSREQGYDPAGSNVKVMPTVLIDGPYQCLGCGQHKTTGAVACTDTPDALWCPVCWAFAKRSDYVLFPPIADMRLGEFTRAHADEWEIVRQEVERCDLTKDDGDGVSRPAPPLRRISTGRKDYGIGATAFEAARLQGMTKETLVKKFGTCGRAR